MVLSDARQGGADLAALAGGTALWCVPVADLGGVARHVIDAARCGIPGWRLVVLCPPGPLADRLRDVGAAVVTGPVSPSDGAATAVRTIRGALHRLRPDLLHTHLAFADITGAAAVAGKTSGRGQRIRTVSTEHGIAGIEGLYQSSAARARAITAVHRARLRRTDRVIAVSDSTHEQIERQWGSASPITVIRNGVDTPEAAPAPVPGLRVLSLSRLAPEKRIDRLLHAFALVLAEHDEARLTVAGTGPEEPALRELAETLGLTDAVDFPGHVDPDAALRRHDVVAQLSTWENLSYTLLDAVAYGRGVVATDVGGNREIVPQHCLVDADDAQAVARHIVTQGMDPDTRPHRNFSTESVETMCARIARVYREVNTA